MFLYKRLAELSKWHDPKKPQPNQIELVPDSKASKQVNCLSLDFGAEPRNVRLRMVLEGVNPYSNQSLQHSTWQVVLLNYNMARDKIIFSYVVLIISKKESLTLDNIDMYLVLLIEEFLQLWEGVNATDISSNSINKTFKLKALLMSCIYDFTGYRLASEQVKKGIEATLSVARIYLPNILRH